MKNNRNISFQELGSRELLKSTGYWLGMAAAVFTAAFAYDSNFK